MDPLIDWMVVYAASTVFQSYRCDSSHYSCISWVSPVLPWGSEVGGTRTFLRQNPKDHVWLEPKTPGVKHFTTETRGTPPNSSIVNPFPHKPLCLCAWSIRLLKTLWEKEKLLIKSNFSFSHSVFYLVSSMVQWIRLPFFLLVWVSHSLTHQFYIDWEKKKKLQQLY